MLKASYGVVQTSPLSSSRTFPSDKDASCPFAGTPPAAGSRQSALCPWICVSCSVSVDLRVLLCLRGFACPALCPWICVSWAFPVSAVTQPVAFPVELLSLRAVAVCP